MYVVRHSIYSIRYPSSCPLHSLFSRVRAIIPHCDTLVLVCHVFAYICHTVTQLRSFCPACSCFFLFVFFPSVSLSHSFVGASTQQQLHPRFRLPTVPPPQTPLFLCAVHREPVSLFPDSLFLCFISMSILSLSYSLAIYTHTLLPSILCSVSAICYSCVSSLLSLVSFRFVSFRSSCSLPSLWFQRLCSLIVYTYTRQHLPFTRSCQLHCQSRTHTVSVSRAAALDARPYSHCRYLAIDRGSRGD